LLCDLCLADGLAVRECAAITEVDDKPFNGPGQGYHSAVPLCERGAGGWQVGLQSRLLAIRPKAQKQPSADRFIGHVPLGRAGSHYEIGKRLRHTGHPV
jgi:hypothetical protein